MASKNHSPKIHFPTLIPPSTLERQHRTGPFSDFILTEMERTADNSTTYDDFIFQL
jgi:hypothetical protein